MGGGSRIRGTLEGFELSVIVETLKRLSTTTSEELLMVAESNIELDQLGIDAGPGSSWRDSVLPLIGLGQPTETLSRISWKPFRPDYLDDLGLTDYVELHREWLNLPWLPRWNSTTLGFPQARLQNSFVSDLIHPQDLTMNQAGPVHFPVGDRSGTGIKHWNRLADSDRVLIFDRLSGECRVADDAFWFVVSERHDAIQSAETIPPSMPPELADALTDLREIVEEAEEKEFEVPTESTCQLADQLLHTMYAISPRRFEIYPMPTGEIAIDGHDGHGRRIIVFCGPNGNIRCLTNENGKRDSYSDSCPHGMMGSFIQGALGAFL